MKHIRLPRIRLPRPRLPRRPRLAPELRPPATGVLRGARGLALAAITTLVAAASVASFMESFRALYEWAHEHGLSVRWSAVWPLQIDVFIAVGELALFVALVDRWQRRSRVLPWVVTLAGLAVSVAGNVGHVGWQASVADKATAAVPPPPRSRSASACSSASSSTGPRPAGRLPISSVSRPISSLQRKRAYAPPWRPVIPCRSTSSPSGSR